MRCQRFLFTLNADRMDGESVDGEVLVESDVELIESSTLAGTDDGSESSDEVPDVSDVPEQNDNRKTKSKKRGRRAQWSNDQVLDVVDIIVNDEDIKKKLLFMNQKNQKNTAVYHKVLQEVKARDKSFQFDLTQVRTKVKKCVAICKYAALTIKTASGIRRFQDDKGYGQWFDILLPVVRTRESCQPELAIEPSVHSKKRGRVSTESEHEDTVTDAPQASTSGDMNKEVDRPTSFVPVRNKRAKTRDDPMKSVITLLENSLAKDPAADLMKFLKEDTEKAREHELKLMSMLLQQPGGTVGNQGVDANSVGSSVQVCATTAQQAYPGAMYQTAPSPHQLGQGVIRAQCGRGEQRSVFETDDNICYENQNTYTCL